MTALTVPSRDEATEYFFTYIDQVDPGVEIVPFLEQHLHETVSCLRNIPESRTLHRYAPRKWTIREVVGHLSDCERLFILPGFDQDQAVATAGSNERTWASLVEEFRTVREATLTF